MRGGIVFGQYLPGESLIHSLDPRAKLLSTIFMGLAVFFSNSWTELILIVVFVILSILLSGISLAVFMRAWTVIWLFLGVLVIFQILFTPGEVIYSYGFLRITQEGLNIGGLLFFRLVTLMLLAALLTFTTSPVNITSGIEILLNPLKRLKLPVHELAMMMTIAIRFLPTLHKEANKIISAQRSRGADFTCKNLTKIHKLVIPVIVPLFVGVFQRADDLATAMEVRCYQGGEGRSRLKEFKYTSKDYFIMTVSFFIFLFAGVI